MSLRQLLPLVILPLLAACREPTPPNRTETARPSAPGPALTRAQGTTLDAAIEPAPSTPQAATSDAATEAAPQTPSENAAEPVLVGQDGEPLPQTEDKPSITSERFRRRIELVAKAIVANDPSSAIAAFFPVVAYQQVKDVQKPERDWKLRLIAAFERDIRKYHSALGKDAEQAKFLGVDVPEESARWMKPGSEGNRVGYYRVLRSRLRFELPSGKTQNFELTSLISWRGEWYVVHLNGFK